MPNAAKATKKTSIFREEKELLIVSALRRPHVALWLVPDVLPFDVTDTILVKFRVNLQLQKMDRSGQSAGMNGDSQCVFDDSFATFSSSHITYIFYRTNTVPSFSQHVQYSFIRSPTYSIYPTTNPNVTELIFLRNIVKIENIARKLRIFEEKR